MANHGEKENKVVRRVLPATLALSRFESDVSSKSPEKENNGSAAARRHSE